MTTTIAVPTPARHFVCPDWCRLEDDRHDVALQDGKAVVDHDGSSFGAFISAGGMTYAETGAVTEVDVTVHELDEQMGAQQLRTLAADALAAAEWLEAQL